MRYPYYIDFALKKLQSADHQAYPVGGCVRDFLLGRAISDFDIATDALPYETKKLFADYPQQDAGLKHGTATIFIDKNLIEITTFRQDGEYLDGRHPEHVTFTKSLQDDLLRRDFTINALAYDATKGILDYVSGEADLKNKVIRAIGNAEKRLEEDALRILRAVRFAAQLDFIIEKNTYQAMIKKLPMLEKISAERKASELIKALMSPAITRVLIDYCDIFGAICPDLLRMKNFSQNNPHHIYDVLEHTAHVIQYCPFDKELRLAALFHDFGKVHSYSEDENGIGHFYGHGEISEQIARETMRALKLDNKTTRNVCLLIRYHDVQFPAERKPVKRWLNKLGSDLFFKLLDLKIADNMAQAPEYAGRQELAKKIRLLATEIVQEQSCFQLKDLAIDGNDLISLGFFGKEIGEALHFLLRQVIDEKSNNIKSELIELVKEKYELP